MNVKGSYILLLNLRKEGCISVGKLGNFSFQKGYYVYVGSALNGLTQRIERHLRKQKKLHWHIDYLLQYANIIAIFLKESTFREECFFAQQLANHFAAIQGFGCSDCTCSSHLFYGSKEEIMQFLQSFHMKKYPLKKKP